MVVTFEELWKFICYDYCDNNSTATYLRNENISRKVKEAFCKYANDKYIKEIEAHFDLGLSWIDNNGDNKYEVYVDVDDIFDSMEFKVINANMNLIYGVDACYWFDAILEEESDCVESLYPLEIDTDNADYNDLGKQIFNCYPKWTFAESDIFVEFFVGPQELTDLDKDCFKKIMSKIQNTKNGSIAFKGDDNWYNFKQASEMIGL